MLNHETEKQLSKFMTKLLRHTPEEFGLVLNPLDGSCLLSELLNVIQTQSQWSWINHEDIIQVVKNSDKQRFEIREDRIRARYGHSHDKVQYRPAVPPSILYHGTNPKALSSILKEGIRPMSRQYVHLSEGTHFASMAGKRRGELVLLTIDTVKARELGITFYFAGNEVWLSEFIPASCCTIN
jgi:putative RNA 2'-phosphotransferase